MEESSRSPEDAARESEPEQQECSNSNGKGKSVSFLGLEFQDGKLEKSCITDCVIVVAGVHGCTTNVQLYRVVMTVKRFMIGERMEVNLESLYHQERQRETPHQRAAVRGSE
ncbi:MAG: hypothetical protein ACYC1T_13790 [Sulfuricaulis sp.]